MTGFKSKKAMAQDIDEVNWADHEPNGRRAAARDKLETWDTPSEAFNEWWNADYDDTGNPYRKDSPAYWAWAGWQAALAQPEQAEVLAQAVPDETLTIVYQSGYYDGKKAALAGRERNFCERCGKRTADLTTIHTCTPPQEKNND